MDNVHYLNNFDFFDTLGYADNFSCPFHIINYFIATVSNLIAFPNVIVYHIDALDDIAIVLDGLVIALDHLVIVLINLSIQ